MISRGNFRDDSAESLMQRYLRGNFAREQFAGAAQNRDGGFIAGSFEREHARAAIRRHQLFAAGVSFFTVLTFAAGAILSA